MNLTNKIAREKANIKATEIAKISSVPRGRVQHSGADYEIEITDIKAIEGGVEVLARAWDNDTQIGFGKKGDVDLERFLIYNPPILVSDPNGDIVRESTNPDTGEVKQRKLREAPQEALLQTLAHIIKVKKQKFGDERIVRGKVGNTTSTFFPAAGANEPVDGYIRKDDETTWSGARDAATGDTADDTGLTAIILARKDNDTMWDVHRGFFLYDTSSIPDTDTISSATLSLAGQGTAATNDDTSDTDIVSSSPASNAELVVGDFDQVGSTVFASQALSSWDGTDGNYNDFTLDANGIANINKTGISKFGARNSRDTDDSAPTGTNFVFASTADETGTSQDPKLVVEHASARRVFIIS